MPLGENKTNEGHYGKIKKTSRNFAAGMFRTVYCIGIWVMASSPRVVYAAGDMTIMQDFGTARDAFYTAYDDIFYVNFDYLSLCVAKS